MTTKDQIELIEAIDEFDRTENNIMERLTELSKRDFYRFKVALRYKRKAQQVRNKISAGA